MKLTIADFSGGLTDSPYTSPENCAAEMDNFLIRKDKTLESAYGLDVYSDDAYRIPANTRVSKLVKLNDSIIAFSGTRAYKVTDSAITELVGPTGNKAFNNGTASSIVSVEKFNNQIHAVNDAQSYEIKIYEDDNGDVQLRTAGLPKPAGTPSLTPDTNESKVYIYAFVYYYSYRVGDVLFEDYSTPTFSYTSSGCDMAGSEKTAISGIPVLSNGADYSWDTTNLKVKIYRTVHTGDTFYYVGQVTNGTTTFNDSETDGVIQGNETLYINGGIQFNDLPPESRYIFEANGTYYRLGIIQNNEDRPERAIQSVTNDPDSVPEGNFIPFKAPLKGGGSVGRSPIVFTSEETLRLDGVIDELGRGTVIPEVIGAGVGLVAHNSITKYPGGLYFAGTDCFYKTDGYNPPVKLARKGESSSKIDLIYAGLISTDAKAEKIQGAYDRSNRRVLWTVVDDEADCDKIFVYDETHDAFSTISFGDSGILPTALLVDGTDIIIGDSRGYLFKMNSDAYNVPVIDTSTSPDNWTDLSTIYSYKSVHMSMGDASINKYGTKINVQGEPQTNLDLQVNSYTNGEPEYKELTPIKISPALEWGDSEFTWGDSAFVWDRTANMNQTRSMAAGRLRFRHRQIQFTNARTTIQESTSDSASYVTVNGVANTVTLVNPSLFEFGANYENHYLNIAGTEYLITGSTADTITVADPDGTLTTSGAVPWEIIGFPKGQRAQILNYTMEFEPLSDLGTKFRGEST